MYASYQVAQPHRNRREGRFAGTVPERTRTDRAFVAHSIEEEKKRREVGVQEARVLAGQGYTVCMEESRHHMAVRHVKSLLGLRKDAEIIVLSDLPSNYSARVLIVDCSETYGRRFVSSKAETPKFFVVNTDETIN